MRCRPTSTMPSASQRLMRRLTVNNVVLPASAALPDRGRSQPSTYQGDRLQMKAAPARQRAREIFPGARNLTREITVPQGPSWPPAQYIGFVTLALVVVHPLCVCPTYRRQQRPLDAVSIRPGRNSPCRAEFPCIPARSPRVIHLDKRRRCMARDLHCRTPPGRGRGDHHRRVPGRAPVTRLSWRL
jgi:hypothetical protein